MRPLEEYLVAFAKGCLAPPPKETVSQWCERNVYIPAPQTQAEGLVRFHGREYCREFIDDFGNPRVTDEVACFGSQTGKTTAITCGVAWTIINDPCGVLWVMPNTDLCRSFSETRWIPILKATKETAKLIPAGNDRHAFKTAQQQIGSAVINFVGSNSPANLASRPARRVILDEVDKFDEGGRGEADAVNLAEQRTKSFTNAQRFKVSTPTVLHGLIWQEFLKGDQRRYFVPCVHCTKEILLAWSKEFTVLKPTGKEAYVQWDREARRADGTWDLERVEKSAHALCPHCGGHILDGHKTKMVRAGVWRPTAQAPANFRSRHLSSLYASTPETSFGRMAVKFLQAKQSLLGLQGFINGDLAEPYVMQETVRAQAEVVSHDSIEQQGEAWQRFLTVDVQQRAPFFWWVVRSWNMRTGDSEGIASGYASTWDDVREIQLRHHVEDLDVVVDSGYNAKEVYDTCLRFSIKSERYIEGWIPAKGYELGRRWRDEPSGALLPYELHKEREPYPEGQLRGVYRAYLFNFDSQYFKDLLMSLREGRGGHKWNVGKGCASEEYWRHLNSKVKRERTDRLTKRKTLIWELRTERLDDHLDDCEVMQCAWAASYNIFDIK